MLAWKEKCEILIWGIGNIGKKFYYRYRDQYTIKGFIDTYSDRTDLYGLPVYRPEVIENSDAKIVIAISNYDSLLKSVLNTKRYFFDVLPYDRIDYNTVSVLELLRYAPGDKLIIEALRQDKEIAILHGNCQIGIITQFLLQNPKFYNKYIIFELPPIYLFASDDLDAFLLQEDLLLGCRLLITQDISDNNAYDFRLSTNYFKSIMIRSKVVMIPNLYFDVYFPQAGVNRSNVLVNEFGIDGMGAFQYGDEILADLAKRFHNSADIIEIIKMDNLLTVELLNQLLQERVNDLRQREDKCDVKMLDYILSKYRHERLFYSRNHPVNSVLKELSIRIMQYLNLDIMFENESNIPMLDISDELIYPSVEKGLNLTFHQDLYKDIEAETKQYTFDQYAKRYLSYCHSVFEIKLMEGRS